MNPFQVNFEELYRRHLCRHSQLGINLLHLVAVVGIYISLLSIALELPRGRWVAGGALVAYFALLAVNLPFRVWSATLATMALILATCIALPALRIWVHIVLIVVWHRFQVWNHRIFDHSHPMDEFTDKYRKGPALFLLLSLYELPILIQFLIFDRRRVEARRVGSATADTT